MIAFRREVAGMNCWQCDRPAHGVCSLCGRGACKEHAKTMPNFVAVYRAKPRKGREGGPGPLRALVAEDALWCGVCKPREQPVEMPELDK
jgi:hypothetical protein